MKPYLDTFTDNIHMCIIDFIRLFLVTRTGKIYIKHTCILYHKNILKLRYNNVISCLTPRTGTKLLQWFLRDKSADLMLYSILEVHNIYLYSGSVKIEKGNFFHLQVKRSTLDRHRLKTVVDALCSTRG